MAQAPAVVMQSTILLFAAGILAGAMNAIAGGGSFITFPALIAAGLPSVVANASSTTALVPGAIISTWATRSDIGRVGDVSLKLMLVISLAGGAAGAILLLLTPASAFDRIVPWLLLIATATFAFGHRAGVALRRVIRVGPRTIIGAQVILAIYGGYFGGAVGIMMMAAWSLLSTADLRTITPARTLLVGAANFAAVVCFVVANEIWWPQTLAMLAGAMFGGYAGARIGRWLSVPILRAVIITVTVMMTAAFFWRAYAK